MSYREQVSALMDELLSLVGANYSRAAKKIVRNGKPMSRQSLTKMSRTGSMKVEVLLELLDAYGVSLKFERNE